MFVTHGTGLTGRAAVTQRLSDRACWRGRGPKTSTAHVCSAMHHWLSSNVEHRSFARSWLSLACPVPVVMFVTGPCGGHAHDARLHSRPPGRHTKGSGFPSHFQTVVFAGLAIRLPKMVLASTESSSRTHSTNGARARRARRGGRVSPAICRTGDTSGEAFTTPTRPKGP